MISASLINLTLGQDSDRLKSYDSWKNGTKYKPLTSIKNCSIISEQCVSPDVKAGGFLTYEYPLCCFDIIKELYLEISHKSTFTFPRRILLVSNQTVLLTIDELLIRSFNRECHRYMTIPLNLGHNNQGIEKILSPLNLYAFLFQNLKLVVELYIESEPSHCLMVRGCFVSTDLMRHIMTKLSQEIINTPEGHYLADFNTRYKFKYDVISPYDQIRFQECVSSDDGRVMLAEESYITPCMWKGVVVCIGDIKANKYGVNWFDSSAVKINNIEIYINRIKLNQLDRYLIKRCYTKSNNGATLLYWDFGNYIDWTRMSVVNKLRIEMEIMLPNKTPEGGVTIYGYFAPVVSLFGTWFKVSQFAESEDSFDDRISADCMPIISPDPRILEILPQAN